MATRGIILLCLLLQKMTVNGFQFATLSHELPWADQPHSFVIDNESLVSPGLVYGSCVTESGADDRETCTFVMERKGNVGSVDHLRICNFTLANRKADERGTHRTILSITAINENHAVLRSYFKETHEHLSILKFSDCKVADIATSEMTKYKVYIPARFDIFEIAGYSPRENTRALVDLNGNVLEKFNNTIPTSSLAVMGTQSKGTFFTVLHQQFLKIERIYDDQTTSTAVAVTTAYGKNKIFSASTIHNFFGLCTRSENLIYCLQVDDQANSKFSIQFEVPPSPKMSALKVFNLPSGGLLLLLFRCNKNVSSTSPECSSIAEDYFVVKKIDSTGKLIGSLYIKKFKHIDNENSIHFFESDKGEMCLSLVNVNGPKLYQIALNVTCFEDRDFYKASPYESVTRIEFH